MVNAIIVAAGKGERMGPGLRKQYLIVAGRPILAHTLNKFSVCAAIDRICLVVPPGDIDFCREHVLEPLNVKKPVRLVAGGTERQHSVYRGLTDLEHKEGLVVIHDGVRPLIDPSFIEDCIHGARVSGACISGIPASDTIKKADLRGHITATVERHGLWLIQTPQVFEYQTIVNAHNRARREGYTGTDDASLVERMGCPVTVICGQKTNIKVTTEEDLKIVAALLASDYRVAPQSQRSEK